MAKNRLRTIGKMTEQNKLSMEEMIRLAERVDSWKYADMGDILGKGYFGRVGQHHLVILSTTLSDPILPWIEVEYDGLKLPKAEEFRGWGPVCIGTSGYCDTKEKQERLDKLYIQARESAQSRCSSPSPPYLFPTPHERMKKEGVENARKIINEN